MNQSQVVVLLASLVLLCGAVPIVKDVNCTDKGPAARFAMHHIDEHHEHGYKFILKEVLDYKVEEEANGCNIDLQLELRETTCHTVNPIHFENCPERDMGSRGVKANCTVLMTVEGKEAKVTRYDCDTKQVHTNEEMMGICPDCPVLLPLMGEDSLKVVHQAVHKASQSNPNEHYFALKEVGRVTTSYMMMKGMAYFLQFVLVETHCPKGSRIMPEACQPICDKRAKHATCRATYFSNDGLDSVDCNYYPAKITTELGPGEVDAACSNHQTMASPFLERPPGLPPTADQQVGPIAPPGPVQPGLVGPPTQTGPPAPPQTQPGPPATPPGSHDDQQVTSPRLPPFIFMAHPPVHICHFKMQNQDQALHPICSWPQAQLLPEVLPKTDV